MIIHNGSITKLKVDAIVNAANPSGLGCFTLGHNCIDNVIHREAGPLLHQECRIKMAARGTYLDSSPIVTGGYNISAKYIMHVAGPQIIPDKNGKLNITTTDSQKLHNCYVNCIKEAIRLNLKTLAFPCISTGLYNFDKKLACKIAHGAVKLFSNYDIKVIFCVFSKEDELLYREQLSGN